MSTLRIPIAVAASVIALVSAKTSFAQETIPQDQTPPASTTTTTMPSTTTTTPATPSTTVTTPPVSTTTTTQAPYNASAGGERYTERSVERRPNRTLLTIGTGMFVVSYGASVITGAVSDRDEDQRLFIPVVGPWLDLSERDCTARGCGSGEDTAKAMIITSGIVQGAGVLLALGSLAIPETTTMEERTITAKKAEKPSVHVLPVSFRAGAGIGAVGRF